MRALATILLLAFGLAFLPGCDNPFSDESEGLVAPPAPTPRPFMTFHVSADAHLVASTPGVEGSIFATCLPQTDYNCGGVCIYEITLDGRSQGSALSSNSFLVEGLPPRPDPGYGVVCHHRPTNSASLADYVVIP